MCLKQFNSYSTGDICHCHNRSIKRIAIHLAKRKMIRLNVLFLNYLCIRVILFCYSHSVDYILFSTYNKNRSFSTWDQDNDRHSTINCASYHRGAWWFSGCYPNSHLNGLYFDARDSFHSIRWNNLTGGDRNIKYVEMKLRSLSGNWKINVIVTLMDERESYKRNNY